MNPLLIPDTGQVVENTVMADAQQPFTSDDPSFPAKPPASEMLNKGRLTVIETVYHQCPMEQPIGIPHSFGRWLETNEQPYGPHKIQLEFNWRPIDVGWNKRSSMLLIASETPRYNVQPTPQQIEEDNKRVVEIAVRTSESTVIVVAEIFPGESARFRPADLSQLLIRCRCGVQRVTITIFPL